MSQHVYFLNSETDIPSAIVAGLLIGVSSSLYLLFTGRAVGLSGMLENLIFPNWKGRSHEGAFVSGLIHGAFLVAIAYPFEYGFKMDPHVASLSVGMLMTSGFLVGLGTRLGKGCTSGHGVVGLGKRSPRSFAFIVSFFITAIATAATFGGIFGQQSLIRVPISPFPEFAVPVSTAIAVGLLVMDLLRDVTAWKDSAITYFCGILFGAGLTIGKMTHPSKIINFLRVGNLWDPSLLFVLGGAVGFNLIVFALIYKFAKTPLLAEIWPKEFDKGSYQFVRDAGAFNFTHIFGGFLFGLGWGISGVCPGPSILLTASFSPAMLYFFPALVAGIIMENFTRGFTTKWLTIPLYSPVENVIKAS